MKLQLNNSEEENKYKEYSGSNLEQMPILIVENRKPMTVAEIMKRKIDVFVGPKKIKDAWWSYNFDTSDAIIYHPDGRIKIILDSDAGKKMNKSSNLRAGSLYQTESEFESAEGAEFSKREKEKYASGEPLTLNQAIQNPIWQTFANADQKMLEEYSKIVFLEGKLQFRYENMMGIYLANPRDVPTLKLWYLDRLKEDGVKANKMLSNNGGRLVGIEYKNLPQRLANIEARAPTLDEIVEAAKPFMAKSDLKSFREKIQELYDK